MIIRTRFIKLSGIVLMSISACVIALAFFLPYLLDVNTYRDDILAALKKAINRPVSFSSGSFAWHFGPSFEFNNVSVREPDGTAVFLSARKITVQLALVPLLKKRIELNKLHLDESSISLIRHADGTLNIDDLLQPGKDTVQMQFKRVRISKSTIVWRDLAGQKGGLSATANNLSLTMDHMARGQKGHVKLSADILPIAGSSSHVSLSGTVLLPAADKPLLGTELQCDADIKQAEIGRFWPYYGRFIPFANPGGRLDFTTSFKGTLSEFVTTGKINITGASVYWPTVFHATLSPRSLQIEYSLKMSERLIDITAIDARTDGFRIKGGVQLFDYRSKDPRIVARASTPGTFRYEDVRNFIPYGIIEHDAADYIENKIKSGIFKLDTGVLDGRISQIAHMEIGDNYKTLTIRGPVDKAVLSYGGKAPTFNTIKGTIELKGKNFNLIGMSGNFGTSPFTLNGTISEYNTDKPSSYPVKMAISPHAPEMAWLADIAGIPKLDYSGVSALVLTGEGHHSAYRLQGEWNLTQAVYSYPGAIRKPFRMPNYLAFSSLIGKTETRITALSYNLSPLALSGSAVLRYGDKPYLGFDLQTNPFQMNASLPILSMWHKYKMLGKVQVSLKGGGNPEAFSTMNYNGTVALNGFSFQPGEKLKTISGINGNIAIRDNNLETTRVTARYGSSLITINGRIKNLNDPVASINLSSPQFFLRDVDLALNRPDASIRRLNAAGTLQDGLYTVTSISGLFNTSNFNVSGVYATGATPKASLTITSTKLDLDDLLLLASPKKTAETPDSSGTDIKLRLNVESGSYGKLHFSKLTAQAQQESGTIYIQNLTTGIFNGKLAAKGRIAPGGGAGNRYDLTLGLVKADADKLFAALDISSEVTGNLSLHGNLTARGENLTEIKKSALGNIQLQMSKGTLRQFSALSKVFSILNFSQLLKFQLPDMVADGMPYNTIKGSFSVKDGILASQDLLINSDAINISVIGTADIVKEQLNVTLGVQPLQTVDKIVNRIPIVGWILTGKDRDIVTAYFEAKGTWSDPQVNAIPVKSLGKGVLNIFRRVFELPVRLFTDTGEVILGQ